MRMRRRGLRKKKTKGATHPRQRLLLVQRILGFEGRLTGAVSQEGASWKRDQVEEAQPKPSNGTHLNDKFGCCETCVMTAAGLSCDKGI